MSARTKDIPYVVVDVFTASQFGGNQLAVITDARGLGGAQMQKIATEFNFAETAFVLPPGQAENTAHVRIFTRAQEVPFAGHPNVGTAYVLARQGDVFGVPSGSAMRFEEKAGLVEVEVRRAGGDVIGATITAPRPLELGRAVSVGIMARCLGLAEDEIILSNHAPVQISVGLQFAVAELSLAALARVRPNIDSFRTAAAEYNLTDPTGRFSLYVYARTGQGFAALQARMFAPLSGNHEDPATGSASAALGAYLASLDSRGDANHRIEIAQGVEMGRPSRIILTINKSGGELGEVRISGDCAMVMRGVLELAQEPGD